MTATALRCVDCGLDLEHDRDAEYWLRVDVLVAPDQVDSDGMGGTTCPATGDEHRIGAAR